jgi:hypothetical protein
MIRFAPLVDSSFESPMRDFINPDIELDLLDQLGMMNDFWRRLGHHPPEFSQNQLSRLRANAQARPRLRVVPTPALSGAERLALGVKALGFSNHHLNPDTPVRPPEAETAYACLLADSTGEIESDGDRYVLNYKTEHGALVDRNRFLSGLLRLDQALTTGEQRIWVVPQLDVQVYPGRTGEEAQDIFRKLNAILIPEALIATRLIHQAAGVLKDEERWDIDYANEVACKIGSDGEPRPTYFATVRLRTQDDRIGMYARQAGSQRVYAGFREATNALAEPQRLQ